jgi:hypothetical protein
MSVGGSERERAIRAAGASVAIGAGLLASVALLAWRIERRAREVEDAIDGVREKTHAIRDIPRVNVALDRMTGDLRRLRTGREEA